MDSEYATYDRPEKVMLWYWGDRQMEGNRQGSVRRLAAHYQWGPLGLDLKRLPSLILFGNVTHISITTHLEMKLCL